MNDPTAPDDRFDDGGNDAADGVDEDDAIDERLGDDEGWQPDPDAPSTTQGRLDAAAAELHALTRAMLGSSFVVTALFAVGETLRGHGYANTTGFVIGALLATLNLWMLAGGFFALLDQRAVLPRLLLGFAGSFVAMVAVAFFVILAHREWTVGFACGLAVPAIGGVVYGLRRFGV